MSLRKFHCENIPAPGGAVLLDKEEEKHLFKILRAEPGDVVLLLDGKGTTAEAKVLPGKTLEIARRTEMPKPDSRLHLYIAPPRRQQMDSVLRQCAELGVWRIVPAICDFSVSEPDGKSVTGRWNDILAEGCKQSGNPFFPLAEPPVTLREALADIQKNRIDGFYGSVEGSVKDVPDGWTGDLAWFVGPEGGFSPNELEMIRKSHLRPLRIGRHILRVETAATAGIAVLTEKA